MINLRDLLTGNIPGNAIQQVGLGDAPDPQFNRFTYNIYGSLGPSPGVNTGMPTLSSGFSGGYPAQSQQAPQPQRPAAPTMPNIPTPSTNPGPGSASYQYPQWAPGSVGAMQEFMPSTESLINPGVLGGPAGPFGGLRSKMTAWKFQ